MSVTFRQVQREGFPLLVGLAGGTGSGKTLSALLLARGLAAGEPFAFVDTENGRAKHYAEQFPEMRWAGLKPPFRPEAYGDAIEAAVEQKFGVVVVDSMSHEWAGDGGCLDWHDELTGGDKSKSPSAWARIKPAHKRMMTKLVSQPAHIVLCFRAEPKIEIVRGPKGLEFVPKESPTGLDGWMPISEKMTPYELTASFLLMADAPGVPRPIKLEDQHRALIDLSRPLDAGVGSRLAAWARGDDPASTKSAGAGAQAGEVSAAGAPRSAAPTPSTPAALTFAQFRHQCRAAFIGDEKIGEVGSRLFPGLSAAELDDRQRGELLEALIADATAQGTLV